MKKLIGTMIAGLALVGCGNAPTQYVINYDDQQAISKGVNAKCVDTDPSTVTSTTAFKTNTTVTVYAGDDAKYYVDFGGNVLSGTKNGSAYDLTDSKTEDNTQADNHEIKTSDVVKVTMTVDGKLVSGSWTEEIHSECDGTNCSDVEKQPIDCIYTTQFRGQQLPDDGAIAPTGAPGGHS